jgi:hypothetical protein
MPKTKTPALHDWQIRVGDASFTEPALTIRASSLTIIDGAYVLRDTYGGILFAAPARTVRYIRRLEPGEDVPAAKEEPKAVEVPADPGPVEVTPAPRPRTTRRK